jgi:hypothetical protein
MLLPLPLPLPLVAPSDELLAVPAAEAGAAVSDPLEAADPAVLAALASRL